MQKIIIILLLIFLLVIGNRLYKKVEYFPILTGIYSIALLILSILLFLTLPPSYMGSNQIVYIIVLALISVPIYYFIYVFFDKRK